MRPPGPASRGAEVFVGREHELAILGGALEQTLGGRGQIVALAGEPGIGKTRTAEVIAHYAESLDLRVLWGRCYEELGAPPYWPWVQLIRACAESYDDSRLRSMLGSGAGDLVECGLGDVPVPFMDRFQLVDDHRSLCRLGRPGRCAHPGGTSLSDLP